MESARGHQPSGETGSTGHLFAMLFSPIRIRNVELRNRLVFQPHYTALGTWKGMPTDAHAAYHEERARGGVGLIVFESQAIHPSGKMSKGFVHAWDPAVIPHFIKVTSAVHEHGARIFSQLTHGGHTSLEHPPPLMWAPTQMPEPSSRFNTKAMDEEDIRSVIDGFAVSARNAVEAGFDGIEIKIAHDGLLRSFASPFFNLRTDGYGGSFANRMRLSLEVLEAIRSATAGKVPIGVRLCVSEFTTFGYDTAYGLEMAECLQASGFVDYFNSDAGSFSSYWMEIPPAAVDPDEFFKMNLALKQASRIPVIAFGRVGVPDRAAEMLRRGEADLIGMARQLIADPETPNKIKAGRADLIRRCISCNDACVFQVGQEKEVRCIHNPGAGREREVNERLLAPMSAKRRIVVAGGGPAGLKVAETAARRGHQVTLIERERGLGGQIRLAAKQPQHQVVGEVTAYLEAMLSEHKVDVRRGVTATAEMLRDLGADVIVVATGSEPNLPGRNLDGGWKSRSLGRQVLPSLAGLEQSFVVSSDQVMSGDIAISGKVVVIDSNGHWEAAGTAEYLAEQGCKVEVITGAPMIGSEMEGGNRALFYRRAAIKGIKLRPNTLIMEIGDHRLRIADAYSSGEAQGSAQYLLPPGEESWLEDIDWVVPVIGRRSREDLFLEIKSAPEFANIRIERTGDCVAPRLIEATIAEAFLLAQTL